MSVVAGPTWVDVVGALSLALLAVAGVTIAVIQVVVGVRVRRLLAGFERLAGPAVADVRQLVALIRTEAEASTGTVRDLRQRILRAADAAEDRLADMTALLDVVQEEVEDTALSFAGALRNVRRGMSAARWGRRLLKRSRGKSRR